MRTTCCLLLLCLLSSMLCLPVQAADAPALNSQSAILYSINSDTVLYEKNADVARAPASLTKIVTTMTVLSMCDDTDATMITVPDGLFAEITAVGGSNINLQVGETLSVTDLLYAVMLPSACDACNVLAYHFGNGDISAFCDRMNEWARAAGCQVSNFENAHGLDQPGHVSSARDIARIILRALEDPFFCEIIQTQEHIIEQTPQHAKRYVNYADTISMLDPYSADYYPDMVGVKSGYTKEAMRCLSSTAERDGERFLAVCMGADKTPKNMAQVDTRALYDWAFTTFETRTLAHAGEVLQTVPLEGATATQVSLVLREDFAVTCPKGTGELSLSFDTQAVYAPPFATDFAGRVLAEADGTVLGEADLYFATTPVEVTLSSGEAQTVETGGLTAVGIAAIAVCALLILLFVALLLIARPKTPPRRK